MSKSLPVKEKVKDFNSSIKKSLKELDCKIQQMRELNMCVTN